MKSRAPCAVFSASMGSFLGWVPRSRGPPGTPSASNPRPQPHQDGGRGAAAGPGLRLRTVRLPSSGSSRDMALQRDPRDSPWLRTQLDRGSGAGLSPAPPRLLQTHGPDTGHHALGGPARRSPPLPCPPRFPQALSPGKLSVRRPGRELGAGRAVRAGGRVPAG